jgi:hypothetical protein
LSQRDDRGAFSLCSQERARFSDIIVLFRKIRFWFEQSAVQVPRNASALPQPLIETNAEYRLSPLPGRANQQKREASLKVASLMLPLEWKSFSTLPHPRTRRRQRADAGK